RSSGLRMRMQRPRHSVTEWNLLSRCPRAYEWTYIRPVVVAEGMPEIGLFTGEKVTSASEQEVTQRELGTRVHSCLERADYDDLKVTEKLKSVDALHEAYRNQILFYAHAVQALEPEAAGRTEALLVNISARTVQTVPVPLPERIDPAPLADEAASIVSGELGR